MTFASAPRRRLRRDEVIESLGRLAEAATARPALSSRLAQLAAVLADQPPEADKFPLLSAAQALYPHAPGPVSAFRSFRHEAGRLAADQGLDLVFSVDGSKRAEPGERRWWVEAIDPTEARLGELSAASTQALDGEPLVRARGWPEREGKRVVRIFFDVAPSERADVRTRCLDPLTARLGSDRDYFFEELHAPALGEDPQTARSEAVRQADVVVPFLSPEYLAWTTRLGGPGPGFGRDELAGKVAPVCWRTLNDRSDLREYARLRTFTADDEPIALTESPMWRGLGSLRDRLDDRLARLHRELAALVGPPDIDPLALVAAALAGGLGDSVDDLAPEELVELLAVRAGLDKQPVALGGSSVDVVDRLVDWASDDDGQPYFVLFGEYGMGKTVASQMFTRRLLELRRDDPSVPLPIYLDLRTLSTEARRREPDLAELLADLLKRAWQTGAAEALVRPADVIHAVQQRGAVVIFDGLDEVLVHLSELQGVALLRELLRILPPRLAAGAAGAPGPGRVVLTCRTHFFRTVRDQHAFFRAQERDQVGPELYESLHLLPFGPDQVRAYLARRRGEEGVDQALDLLRSVHDLEDLASRPYNLRLITEQLERIERLVADQGRIDAAALYGELVLAWLERDVGKHQLDRAHKLRLMEDLALELWRRSTRRIDVEELERWLRRRLCDEEDLARWFQLARPDPAVLAEDLRTATFIVRPGADHFEFAHTSLLEYFLARALHRAMAEGRPDAWAIPEISEEAMAFLVQIAKAERSAGFVANLRACGEAYMAGRSENVVRYVVRASEGGGPAPSLQGFALAGADLRRLAAPAGAHLDLRSADLAGADLREACLHEAKLDGARLGGARLDRAELHRCTLRQADLSHAELAGAVLRGCALDGVVLDGATGAHSQWLWCSHGGAAPAHTPVAGALVAPAIAASPDGARPEVLAGAAGRVGALAWSGRGLLAVASGWVVTVWNPRSGAHLATLRGHGGEVLALAWSPDGATLASGGDFGARLWNPARPGDDPDVLGGHDGGSCALAWSPDGSALASGGGDGAVRLWDPARPGDDPAVLGGHGGRVWALAWSPDGSALASGGIDGGVRLWDPARPGDDPALLGSHLGWVWALAWSPDGSALASGGDDGGVRLWDPARPGDDPALLGSHLGWVWALAWSPDGSALASSGDDGAVRLWDPARPGDDPALLRGHDLGLLALAWSPDGSALASGDGGNVRLWDPARPGDGPALLGGHVGGVRALAWSPDGSALVGGGAYGAVYIWDLAGPGDSPALVRGHRGWVSALVWSPDGSALASGGDGGAVRLWDATRPGAGFAVLGGHGEGVSALVWSPDGSVLASGGGDSAVRLWDAKSLRLISVTYLLSDSAWCQITGDGRLLACAGDVWRWLRWRIEDPASGTTRLLAAEHFGPLPAAVPRAPSTTSP